MQYGVQTNIIGEQLQHSDTIWKLKAGKSVNTKTLTTI